MDYDYRQCGYNYYLKFNSLSSSAVHGHVVSISKAVNNNKKQERSFILANITNMSKLEYSALFTLVVSM